MPQAKIQQLAAEIAALMSQHWGGQTVYIPDSQNRLPDDLDRCIHAQFDGGNHATLAVRFGVTLQRVYRAIKACSFEAASPLTKPEAAAISEYLMASARRNVKRLTSLRDADRAIKANQADQSSDYFRSSPPEHRTIRADGTLSFAGQTWFVPDTFMPGDTIYCSPAQTGHGVLVVDRHGQPRSTWALPLHAHSQPCNDSPVDTKTSSSPSQTLYPLLDQLSQACGKLAEFERIAAMRVRVWKQDRFVEQLPLPETVEFGKALRTEQLRIIGEIAAAIQQVVIPHLDQQQSAPV